MSQSSQRIHVVPVGGAEPTHTCHSTCFCSPLIMDDGKMAVHHAQDLREARERQGIIDTTIKRWVLMNELID